MPVTKERLNLFGIAAYPENIFPGVRVIDMTARLPSTNVGSGSAAVSFGLIIINTGSTANSTTTANSYQLYSDTNQTNLPGGDARQGLDWTRRIAFAFRGYLPLFTANAITRIGIKNTGFGAATARALYAEFRSNRLWLIAHDGTTLTEHDTGTDLPTGQSSATIEVRSFGDGRADIIMNGVIVGEIATGAPNSVGNQAENFLTLNAGNFADAAEQRFHMDRNIYLFGG